MKNILLLISFLVSPATFALNIQTPIIFTNNSTSEVKMEFEKSCYGKKSITVQEKSIIYYCSDFKSEHFNGQISITTINNKIITTNAYYSYDLASEIELKLIEKGETSYPLRANIVKYSSGITTDFEQKEDGDFLVVKYPFY